MSDKTSNFFHTGEGDVFGDGGVREQRVIQALIDHMKERMPTGFFTNNDMLDWIKPDAWMIMETSIRSELIDWSEGGKIVARNLVGTTTTHRLSCKHGHGNAEVIEKNDMVIAVNIKELSKVTFGMPPARSSRPPSIEEMYEQKKQNEENLVRQMKDREEESVKATEYKASRIEKGFANPVSQPYKPASAEEPTWGTW